MTGQLGVTNTLPATGPETGSASRLKAALPGLGFFACTHGVMAMCGGLAILTSNGRIQLPISPVALIGLAGLAVPIAAVGASAAESGSVGVRVLLERLVRWRVPLVWYAVAVGGPALVMLVALLVDRALGVQFSAPPASVWQTLPLLALVYAVIAVIEEVGWRGYAQPWLQNRMGALCGALVLGLLWGLWHLPQWFVPETGQADKWPFWVFLAWTMSLSILYAWILGGGSGSVLLIVVAHTAVNLYPEPWVAAWQAMPETTRGIYPSIFIAAVQVVAALGVALFLDSQTLTRIRGHR